MNDSATLKELLSNIATAARLAWPETNSASLVVDRGPGVEPAVLPVIARPTQPQEPRA